MKHKHDWEPIYGDEMKRLTCCQCGGVSWEFPITLIPRTKSRQEFRGHGPVAP